MVVVVCASWYVHRKMGPQTSYVVLEMVHLLDLKCTGLPARFLEHCPILFDMFKDLWFSIRHHSQKTESIFNLIDITDKNAKNLSFSRLIARVVARAHQTQKWQQERRAAHEPKLKRKAAGAQPAVISVDVEEDEEEANGGVSKNSRLVHTAKEVRMGTNQAINHGKDVYTSACMKSIRDVTRVRHQKDPQTGKRFLPKKEVQRTIFNDDDDRLAQHWGQDPKTGKSTRTIDFEAAAAAIMPTIQDKKEAALPALHKGEMAKDLIAWEVTGFSNDKEIKAHSADEVRERWKLAVKDEGLDTLQQRELWQSHLDARELSKR